MFKNVLLLLFIFTLSFAKNNEISFAVTDNEGLEELSTKYGPFAELLKAQCSLKVNFYPVTNRTAAIEAFNRSKVDYVLTGPAEYVIMRSRTKAVPLVAFTRDGYYYSIIVTSVKSGITHINQLKNTKIALSAVGSTSGHLGPFQLLKDGGLDPLKDIEPVYVNYNIAWQALKRGDVKSMGIGAEKFYQLLKTDKDSHEDEFIILAKGRDLPPDILAAGEHMGKETNDIIKNFFLNHADEIRSALKKGEDVPRYTTMKFKTELKDEDYDYVRTMYSTAGFQKYAQRAE